MTFNDKPYHVKQNKLIACFNELFGDETSRFTAPRSPLSVFPLISWFSGLSRQARGGFLSLLIGRGSPPSQQRISIHAPGAPFQPQLSK